MAIFTKITDFLVSEKRALRHQRDLAVTAREQWRKLANDIAKDCETFRAERDEARAQIGFANEAVARLSKEQGKLRDLYPRLYAAEEARDTAQQKVEWLEEELRQKGWDAYDFRELYGHEEPMTKQDVKEEVGHDRYRGIVEDAEKP